MAKPPTADAGAFIGPRLRRLRRDLGFTQASMADDLGLSASYIALLERNHRPVTAEVLLKLARVYQIDLTELSGRGDADLTERVRGVLTDPLFSDLDLSPSDPSDLVSSHPGMAEALIRLYTAHQENQHALADRAQTADGTNDALGGVDEVRAFLTARQNYFPVLDEQAERLSARIAAAGGTAGFISAELGHTVRRMGPDVMNGAVRRLDYHRRSVLVDDRLDRAGTDFQLALQIAYLVLGDALDAAVKEGQFATETTKIMARRAVANYAAGALMMPYGPFTKAAEALGYDVEALGRRFGSSFEQTAHRLCTLSRPTARGVPFFFIRVDAAGNVSKRFDAAGFPFARHGGSCPRWSLHHAFGRPREILTEIVELPGGERFFSIARTVTAGGGGYGAPTVTRAVALGCAIEHAERLIYLKSHSIENAPVQPIGVTCRLCHRADCAARAEPPIGRRLQADDHRRMVAPFGFDDA